MQPSPRFAVDHMLGKLGTYLRCLGFDARPAEGGRTHELIRAANAEERVFLTRNARLPAAYPAARRWLRVASADPVAQLAEVVHAFGLDPTARAFSRCVRCNLELVATAVDERVRARVPARVLERHADFWTCPGCGTVFWRGAHVRNTCAKLGLPDVSLRRDGLDPW